MILNHWISYLESKRSMGGYKYEMCRIQKGTESRVHTGSVVSRWRERTLTCCSRASWYSRIASALHIRLHLSPFQSEFVVLDTYSLRIPIAKNIVSFASPPSSLPSATSRETRSRVPGFRRQLMTGSVSCQGGQGSPGLFFQRDQVEESASVDAYRHDVKRWQGNSNKGPRER